MTWVWGLYPVNEVTTRLVSRVRMQYDWLSPALLFNLLLDVGDIVMMRKCLLGIKERAEALAGNTAYDAQKPARRTAARRRSPGRSSLPR